MSARAEAALFTAALGCWAALFGMLAWGLESKGRLGPLLLAGAILPLTIYQLRLDLRGEVKRKPAPPQEKQSLAWALALPPAIYLIGCVAAVGLHTLLFVRLQARRSWPTASVCAVLAALPIFALARTMLRPELLGGALGSLFAR